MTTFYEDHEDRLLNWLSAHRSDSEVSIRPLIVQEIIERKQSHDAHLKHNRETGTGSIFMDPPHDPIPGWKATLRELEGRGVLTVWSDDLCKQEGHQSIPPYQRYSKPIRRHRDDEPVSGDLSFVLTQTGHALVAARRDEIVAAENAARRKRANEPKQRNASARDAIVSWLYQQPRHKIGNEALTTMPTPASYEGDPLQPQDIERAIVYLIDCGLLTASVGVHDQYRLTRRGIDCAEQYGGSVNQYLADNPEAGGHQTVNISGSGHNIAWQNRTVTQTATTTGLAGEEIMALAKAIVEASPSLQLSDEQANSVSSHVAVIEGELARDEADRHLIKTLMQRILAIVSGATESTLGLLLTGYARELMQRAGIPLD